MCPRPDLQDGTVYENQDYGFAFRYPAQMSVEESANLVTVNSGSLQLRIAFRRAEENIQITGVGEQTGEFHPYNEVLFLGQLVQPSLNINEDRIIGVYLGGPGTELTAETSLRFAISLINTEGSWIANAQVDEMLQILTTFELVNVNN